MKKYIYFLLLGISISFSAQATPGDTTWVQANVARLSWYGNYDTATVFPALGAKTYRKIYMYFTLGKYVCPTGSTWCGDWDYTVLNYLITPGGQAIELSRLITPYANAGAPRTPWGWKQNYIYDVTDYVSLLHDTATMRILYSGYSGGFTADIKFAFIEGIPDRNILGISRLWNGSFSYGDTTRGGINDINTHFSNTYNTAPIGTIATQLKFIVTGHGSDPNYCNEFCLHHYQVMLDNRSIATETIWRSDCGINELYPQSGTWLYQRANWCPGSLVVPHYDVLPGITSGSSYNLSLMFDPYASTGGASYTTEAQVFYYGAMNKALDASLDQIIAPTNDSNHFRENTFAGQPVIHVKNTGSTTINNIQFQYQVLGTSPVTYTWSGTLAALQETDVTLPNLPDLTSVAGTTSPQTFVAKILQVNSATDNDSTNNTLSSQFVPVPVFPSPFKIVLRTNNEDYPVGSGICETSWQIYDMTGAIVASRLNASINTTFNDTVRLPAGYYKFQITDSSCDGLQWWANAGTSINVGYLHATTMTGAYIAMHGYNYSGTYHDDFGCLYDQYFVVNAPLAIQNINDNDLGISAYPNPASNEVTININGMQQVSGNIQVIDALGRVVITKKCTTAEEQLNVSSLSNGVYTILFISNNDNRLQTRLLISK